MMLLYRKGTIFFSAIKGQVKTDQYKKTGGIFSLLGYVWHGGILFSLEMCTCGFILQH